MAFRFSNKSEVTILRLIIKIKMIFKNASSINGKSEMSGNVRLSGFGGYFDYLIFNQDLSFFIGYKL